MPGAQSLLLTFTLAAHASGLDAPQVGTIASGPASADAAAVHHNPAMLAALPRTEVLVSGGVALGRLRYARERRGRYPFADGLVFSDPVDPEDLDPTRTGAADPVDAQIVSPTGGLFAAGPVWRDRVFLGGGLSAPYAAPLRLPTDGAQRFALQEVNLIVAEATLSLAARVHPMVGIGVGGSYLFGTASLRRVQDFAALDLLGEALGNPPIGQENSFGQEAPTTVREQDVLARPFLLRNGIAHGGAFQVGLSVHPLPTLDLGIAWRHGATLALRGDVQLDLDDPFFTDDLAAQGLSYPRLLEGEGTLTLQLPHRLHLGIGGSPADGVRLDLLTQLVLWNRLDALRLEVVSPGLVQPELGLGDTTTAILPRAWRPTVHAEVRAAGPATPWLTVTGRLGYQSSASPDATVDVSSPDGHRLVGGAGLTFRTGRLVSLLLDGRVEGIVPRTVTTSDFDLGNGRYDLVVGAIGLHLIAQVDPRPARDP